ncbi:hypothetical protein [Bradyrhizobium sp. LMTR 3]|uniref:hypothetical protein n=1 Tax=Bradyrhizobium sp. LMTR 3 TaxID=189873 RepID=UPI000810980E|nr:hypothetical protein [Bradyrhizobium sp. LMTR 3]OCK62387.1 hypothetical protein LMTR3_04550 [Bradyrhizobium sp. LMTR 3]
MDLLSKAIQLHRGSTQLARSSQDGVHQTVFTDPGRIATDLRPPNSAHAKPASVESLLMVRKPPRQISPDLRFKTALSSAVNSSSLLQSDELSIAQDIEGVRVLAGSSGLEGAPGTENAPWSIGEPIRS